MSKNFTILCAAVFVLSAVATRPARAHFILLKPDSWLNEDQSAVGGGAPQKAGPCGPGGYDDVQPVPVSNKTTTVHVGDTVHVQWQITIPHDGYFRISLQPNVEASKATLTDFPDPSFTDATACSFDMTKVPTGSHDNVLMDGIDSTATMQDVTIPDKPCDKCTMQVIMVMKDHGPPNCIYYHCANLQILAAGGQSGTGGTGGMSSSGGTGGSTGSGGMAATTGAGGMGGMRAGAGGSGTAGTSAAGSGGKAGTTAGSGGSTMLPSTTGSAGTSSTSGAMPSGTAGSGGAAASSMGLAGSTAPGSSPSSKSSGGCEVASPGALRDLFLPLGFALFALQRRRGRPAK